jgi:hypothetical protein
MQALGFLGFGKPIAVKKGRSNGSTEVIDTGNSSYMLDLGMVGAGVRCI